MLISTRAFLLRKIRNHLGWQSEQLIQNTYKVTSWFGGTVPQHRYLKKYFKFRNPVFKIPRMNEPVATDSVVVTHLSSMMEVPWPSSLLERTPYCVMLMG